jgi:hypothetical protein
LVEPEPYHFGVAEAATAPAPTVPAPNPMLNMETCCKTFMLTFLLFKKVALLYGRVGAKAAGATSKFLSGAAST